jgi:hypothetical protein
MESNPQNDMLRPKRHIKWIILACIVAATVGVLIFNLPDTRAPIDIEYTGFSPIMGGPTLSLSNKTDSALSVSAVLEVFDGNRWTTGARQIMAKISQITPCISRISIQRHLACRPTLGVLMPTFSSTLSALRPSFPESAHICSSEKCPNSAGFPARLAQTSLPTFARERLTLATSNR